MGRQFTAFKILITLIIIGLIAIPITASLSLTQFQFYQNPIDTLTPAAIDSNGVITKNTTIYVSNFGLYDVNSLFLVTTVLNTSLSAFSEPKLMLWPIPKGSVMPIKIVMLVNTTDLAAKGTIGDFLNTSSFVGQTILSVRYAFALASLSTILVTPLGGMSPMYNLRTPINASRINANQDANVTFFFLNSIQEYDLHIDAELRNGSGQVATGSGDYTVSSATSYMPTPYLDNIILASGGTLAQGTYILFLNVTSPFGYVYTNSSFGVI